MGGPQGSCVRVCVCVCVCVCQGLAHAPQEEGPKELGAVEGKKAGLSAAESHYT